MSSLGLSGQTLPPAIAKRMKAWRAGFLAIQETGYVEYHHKAARESLEDLKRRFGVRVHCTEILGDGWFDGMTNLQAVVETRKGSLMRIKWCDSHGNGGWYRKGAGWSLLYASDFE